MQSSAATLQNNLTEWKVILDPELTKQAQENIQAERKTKKLL